MEFEEETAQAFGELINKLRADIETIDEMDEEVEHRLFRTELKKMKSKFTTTPRAALDKLRK